MTNTTGVVGEGPRVPPLKGFNPGCTSPGRPESVVGVATSFPVVGKT